jgi:hypothetical protein
VKDTTQAKSMENMSSGSSGICTLPNPKKYAKANGDMKTAQLDGPASTDSAVV